MLRGTSFIAQTFSVGGTPSIKERDFMAERAADRVTHAQLVKEQRWDKQTVDSLTRFGVLQTARTGTELASGPNGLGGGLQNIYSRRKLAEAIAELQALAKALR